MRIPASGGAPRSVFESPVPGELLCSLPPSNVCVLNEHDGNHLAIYAVDPDKGKGRELAQISVDSPFSSSALSPDGSRLAITMEDRIRILTLKPGVTGASEFRIFSLPAGIVSAR